MFLQGVICSLERLRSCILLQQGGIAMKQCGIPHIHSSFTRSLLYYQLNLHLVHGYRFCSPAISLSPNLCHLTFPWESCKSIYSCCSGCPFLNCWMMQLIVCIRLGKQCLLTYIYIYIYIFKLYRNLNIWYETRRPSAEGLPPACKYVWVPWERLTKRNRFPKLKVLTIFLKQTLLVPKVNQIVWDRDCV